MRPHRLRLKGFMSYRDDTVISFDGSTIWAICGPNGTGKSTIFDAICFALYGESRLGKQHQQELIYHQVNELLVEFDFAVGSQEYRVRRTVQRRGQKTQQAYRLAGGGSWQPIPGTDKKDNLATWTQQLLGLDCQSFTFSVLLRQGKTDALLTADAPQRHALLSQIIDLTPYERLHKRACDYQRQYEGEIGALKSQLQGLPAIQEETLRQLEEQLLASERLCNELNRRQLELARLQALAQQWERLLQEQERLQEALASYEHLLRQAHQIEQDAIRLEELERVLPPLQSIQKLLHMQKNLEKKKYQLEMKRSLYEEYDCSIDTLMKLDQARVALQAFARERVRWRQAARRLAELEREREQDATALARLQEQEGLLRAQCEAADTRLLAASEERARCQTLLAESQKRLRRFNEVDGTQVCRYCGQPLTPEHLERERARLNAELLQVRQEYEQAALKEKEAKNVYNHQCNQMHQIESDIQSIRDRAFRHEQERQQLCSEQAVAADHALTISAQLAPSYLERIVGAPNLPFDPRRHLSAGSYPTPEDLNALQRCCQSEQERLQQLQQELGRRTDSLTHLETLRRTIQAESVQLRDQLVATGRDLTHCQQRICDEQAMLPADWRSRALDLAPEHVADWEDERQGLQGARERLQELARARYQHEQDRQRLQDIKRQFEQIPPAARRAAAEVVQEQEQIHLCYEEQVRQQQAQGQQLALQREQFQRRQQLERELQKAETRHRRYKRLAVLLGREHLQHYLIQQAERGIIYHANDILMHISNGSLQLLLPQNEGPAEMAGRDASESKALELRVINSAVDAQRPQSVKLLGGGQQFRIAVSLALAIGRYAGSLHQRVESVMIDEGFGSLDEQGRAEIIQALRDFEGLLKRIIVISHQREFFDEFEHKYYVDLQDGSSRVSVR
ncbi:AAA family ATPase [Thermogemmatispora tikiterensis]|uniref:Nuclease SbcCD subunit C n=1 Tax=Thermogemmatispora tikiterensis TaxID=1825093 RepID=A0A328VB36_9CHLR|nr:SMC family ATPase [Thermogemmatispora tikiterensis]RAQ93969.1 hypothetical protein A4R35_00395 [Thermogemmatispora tikiterensis]